MERSDISLLAEFTPAALLHKAKQRGFNSPPFLLSPLEIAQRFQGLGPGNATHFSGQESRGGSLKELL